MPNPDVVELTMRLLMGYAAFAGAETTKTCGQLRTPVNC